jgi:predicted alpha/beta-fold hydrolase
LSFAAERAFLFTLRKKQTCSKFLPEFYIINVRKTALKKILSILFTWVYFSLSAQNIYYESLALGSYNVGFTDTILYQKEKPYKQYGYEGDAPIFVQIWHPIHKVPANTFLKVSDFLSNSKNTLETNLSKELKENFEKSFIRKNLSQDYLHFDKIDYSPERVESLLERINQTTTISSQAELDSALKFPVIVYHHGSTGISYDNYILAEYLASKGYIVVSANFNWPFEKQPHGFSPNTVYEIEAIKQVTKFASGLTQNKKIGFIGHSWGAQAGLFYLHEPGWADAFISLETTLELWNNATIHKKWPRLSQVIKENSSNYRMPMLFLANRGDHDPVDFQFFKTIRNTPVTFCSSVSEFGHEFYANLYSMRYLYRSDFKQPDVGGLKKQLDVYIATVGLIGVFMDHHLKGKLLNYNPFQKYFFVTSSNHEDDHSTKPSPQKEHPSSP